MPGSCLWPATGTGRERSSLSCGELTFPSEPVSAPKACLLINHFELFGLQQVFAHLTQRALPEAQFKTPLLYRCVRHPLYLGLLLGFWSVPVMTAGRLLFALGFSVYILIGIAFEERDLLAQFGELYRRYRAAVGMLLPRRSKL